MKTNQKFLWQLDYPFPFYVIMETATISSLIREF